MLKRWKQRVAEHKGDNCDLRDACAYIEELLIHTTEYEKIEASLKGLPMTYYPALLKTLVLAAKDAGTFNPGRIHIFVKEIEDVR